MSVKRSRVAAGLGAIVLASTLAPAPAVAAAPGCAAGQLSVVRGQEQGAAGHRFDRFRIQNTGSGTCRLSGYPTFRFRSGAGHPVGFSSQAAGVPVHAVQLRPGGRTAVTVETVNPSIPVASQCRAAAAKSVDIRLPRVPHVYNRAITIRVCTTKQFRPTAYPVGF